MRTVKRLSLDKSVSTQFFADFIGPDESGSVFKNCDPYCFIFSFL